MAAAKPYGPDKKALANNEVYDHDIHTHFPKAVMALIRPIFVDLAKDELLKKFKLKHELKQ